MSKLLVICGPTATGKTALGIKLAKEFNGEIVSADSRQVYIGMDIATGKDLPANSKFEIPSFAKASKGKQNSKFQIGYYLSRNIPVWMLDVVRPNQEFSVADYVEIASKILNNIWRRKKLPIVVGGTGFYIKVLVDGIGTLGVLPDWELRKNLQNNSVEELFEMLARLDGEKAASMNASDRRNPRRLMRAIEMATSNRKMVTQRAQKNDREHRKEVLFIGLMASYKELYRRIDKRIEGQVRVGAEEEVRQLLEQGYNWDLPAMTAMGYGVWRPYFEGKASKEEVIQRWKYEEHAYARRQMTWFKHDHRLSWFDIMEKGWSSEVERLINEWYNRLK